MLGDFLFFYIIFVYATAFCDEAYVSWALNRPILKQRANQNTLRLDNSNTF